MKAPLGIWPILVAILAVSLVIAACAGHDWATPGDLARAVAGDPDMRSRLLLEWRMPRVLAAALVGALLGLGGTIFQGVFRNPLAEPYLLGSAGGAALGATVALLVPLAFPQSLSLPLFAFAGAWGATVLVLAISRVAGASDAAGMLLAGVAVAAILGALRSFLMLALSDETVSLQLVLSWVLGGVQTPTWGVLGLLAIITAACLGLTLLFARGLDVLGLGETMAVAFGLNVRQLHRQACAVLAGFGGGRGRGRLRRPRCLRRPGLAAYRALARRAAASCAAAGLGAGRRRHRHTGRCHRARGAAAGRNPARSRHRGRRRAILHPPAGRETAHMTVIAADGVTLQRGGPQRDRALPWAVAFALAQTAIGRGDRPERRRQVDAAVDARRYHRAERRDRSDRRRGPKHAGEHRARQDDRLSATAVRAALGPERRRTGAARRRPASGAAPRSASTEPPIVTYELAAIHDRRWSTLSGGERARVLLAMVLAVDPPALLADEPGASPTSATDSTWWPRHGAAAPTTGSASWVMHDLDLAFRYFERVVVVDRGRIVADGPSGELFDDPRLDAAFGVRFERLRSAHGPLLCAT